MIRVLHFAGIINRWDIIDVVLTRLDRSRFDLRALTGVPPRQVAPYSEREVYPTRCLSFPCGPRNYGRMLSELLREIREFRPHIVQAHHYHENLIAALAVRMARVPAYVVGRHYSDHIYYLTQGLKRRVFLAGEGFSNRTASRIAVPATDIARLLTERQGVPAGKVEVIPFGLDFNRYRPSTPDAPERIRREHGLEGRHVLLSCCRLNPEKGLEYLLQAMPAIRERRPDARLVMVGSGPMEETLRRQAAELRIEDAVLFAGWRDDALDWVAAADAVVIPSMCESFCQVLMEGLALGRPVIMTPVGAAPDVLGADERGILVPKADSTAISEAVLKLAADPAQALELGHKGREYLHAHLGADQTAARYAALYEALSVGR